MSIEDKKRALGGTAVSARRELLNWVQRQGAHEDLVDALIEAGFEPPKPEWLPGDHAIVFVPSVGAKRVAERNISNTGWLVMGESGIYPDGSVEVVERALVLDGWRAHELAEELAGEIERWAGDTLARDVTLKVLAERGLSQ